MTLSLEEWRKLSEEQKGIRYKELSDHELSEEEKKSAKKEFDEFLVYYGIKK